MKNTASEIKNELDGINRLHEAEDRVSDLEDKVAENTKKKKKKNDNSLGDLWDNIKHNNIPITGVPGEEREPL